MGDLVPMSIINSISNFRVRFSSNAVETELVKRYGRKIDEILDLLKMVIDGVLTQVTPDDKLLEILEELDVTINEALKLVGSWDWMMSRIYFVNPLSLSFLLLSFKQNTTHSIDLKCFKYLIHCMILANYYMKVTQVESLITKMQEYALEVCEAVNSLALPSETNCISMYLEVIKNFIIVPMPPF